VNRLQLGFGEPMPRLRIALLILVTLGIFTVVSPLISYR
jgi:hypothetical protein